MFGFGDKFEQLGYYISGSLHTLQTFQISSLNEAVSISEVFHLVGIDHYYRGYFWKFPLFYIFHFFENKMEVSEGL